MKKLILFAVFYQLLNCSAYCHSGNRTASGVMPAVGMCAMDKVNGVVVPFGTVIKTEDGRRLVVTDRFGDGRSNCLDIFLPTESECWQFGRQWLKCRIEVPE